MRECDGECRQYLNLYARKRTLSRAHITLHNSHIDPHFSNVATSALAQDTRDECRAFLSPLSSLCHILVECTFHPFPSCRFTCSVSRPSASTTSLERARLNASPSPHWSGMSGRQLTHNTGYEPNICAHINEEHTPTIPDSNRNFCATMTEDPEGFPQSGASSSSKQTAASRVPTVLGSLGTSLWKQMRDYESVDSRTGIQETGANLDRESVVSTLFRSH